MDMDAFFASIEQRDRPELRGLPVIVGADPQLGRGVVSTASYEARKFGVHSAMPISMAYRLCPKGVFLPCDFRRYNQVSKQIRAIFSTYTPQLEVLSNDEAFLDVTRSQTLFGHAVEIARSIKYDVRLETGLTCSAGLSSIKFVSKIASDFRKPDGLTIIKPGFEREFLAALPIAKLWGVGETTQEKLERRMIRTIGDVAKRSPTDLERMFGSHGRHLWRLANALDTREVRSEPADPKSIGQETTFPKDTDDIALLERTLLYLCEKATARARRDAWVARTVVLKFRFDDFRTLVRQTHLFEASNDVKSLYFAARQLLQDFLPLRQPVRLIGVSMRDLEPEQYAPKALLASFERHRQLDSSLDRIRTKFGREAIARAALLKLVNKSQ